MSNNYTSDEKIQRAQEFVLATQAELRSLMNLAEALFENGEHDRGLNATDIFMHQSLERSTHLWRILESGEWPVMSNQSVGPEQVRELAKNYHRESQRIADGESSKKMNRKNWRSRLLDKISESKVPEN